MAKFIPILGNLHGSMAGNTFSYNRFGAYLRNRVTPVNPKTDKQSTVRNFFAGASSAWRTLSEGNRNSWNDVAGGVSSESGYGYAPNITGQNLMVGFWTDGMRRDTGIPETAPPLDKMPMVESLSSVIDTAPTDSFVVTAVLSGVATDVMASVYATAPYSAGINFVAPSKYRYLGDVTINDLGSGHDLTAEYEAAFGELGPLNVGQKVSTKLVPFTANNYRGVPVTSVDIVT